MSEKEEKIKCSSCSKDIEIENMKILNGVVFCQSCFINEKCKNLCSIVI